MNFEKMINAEETHLGVTLGNKERLLVDNLLREMLVTSIKTVAPLEAKLKVAVELLISLRSLIELSMDSEHNYESWLRKNREALASINGEGV